MNPKKSEPRFTQDALLQAAAQRIRKEIERHRELKNEEVPPGWFTAAELCAAMKMDAQTVRRTMRQINVPTQKFRKWVTNSYRALTYYKP